MHWRYFNILSISIAFFFKTFFCYSQTPEANNYYEKAYADITEALDSNIAFNFKQIVFLTENTFLSNQLDYLKFNNTIQRLKVIALAWMQANPLKNYPYKDSIDFHKNLAIYKILKDTIIISNNDTNVFAHLPYDYDFDDSFGSKDWSKMFVTKLFVTHKGNCHSLPYLYKILADELGATCWLGLAPNHIYIKNRCKKIGWYNTELTSGTFPIDAWITASGYIPLQAIQNGIYMDTLSNQQAIALCVLDLAKGYEFQTRNYEDGFMLKCCDLVLQYHPVNVQAMLLKAETLKRIYEKQKVANDLSASVTYQQMEAMYIKLFDLGYREMPEKMYLDWLKSVNLQKNNFNNKNIKEAIQVKKKR